MMNTNYSLTSEGERELKDNIQFYLRHLELKELKILEKMAHELSSAYSDSYREWRNKETEKHSP